MTSKRIKNGDEVTLVFDGDRIPATVINEPRGEGDLWQFETRDGKVCAFNPYHPGFIGMVKRAAEARPAGGGGG